MFRKSLVIGAVAGLGALSSAYAADLPSKKAPVVASPAPFFFVNDNVLSLSYQFRATDPGVPLTTAKTVLNFTHFDVWALGTNFFTVDFLKSDNKDPAAPCGNFLAPGTVGCAGATEVYGLFRSTFGFNEVFGTKAFSAGPLLDVSLEIGGDANSENNFLAPAKRDIVTGLEFTFALPYKGHLNISPLYYKEWNHNTFTMVPWSGAPGTINGNTNFDGTWAIETNYSMDLGFLPEAFPLTFSGYSNFYGPKGNGVGAAVPGAIKTVVEFNSQQKLSLDVSKMMFGPSRSHFLDLWVGYRYWQNKFGLDHTRGVCIGANSGSCTEQTWTTGVSVKF